MISTTNRLLFVAGLGGLATAFLHVGIILGGAPAYRYFGAGERMAQLAESGSLIPAITTFGITVFFCLCALYAFSGAAILRPLPFLTIGLIGIGALFTLRGLFAPYQMYQLINTGQTELIKQLLFSLSSLGIGLFYLGGTVPRLRGRGEAVDK